MASASDEGDAAAAGPMMDSAPQAPPSGPGVRSDWETKFIDDLVAANRLKTYLVSHGTIVPKEVLFGLAALSEIHQFEIERFIEEARPRQRRFPLFRRSGEGAR